MNKLRHKIWKGCVSAALLTGAIHLLNGFTYGKQMEYVEACTSSPTISQELDGYTIAFVSDVHGYPQEKMQQVVDTIQQRKVDLLLLGGDFSSRSNRLNRSLAQLAQVAPPDGIYGVEGNHDQHQQLGSAMAAHGMVMLENTGVQVRPGLYVAGTKDMWNRDADMAKAVAGAQQGDFVLLCSHNPDLAAEQGTQLFDLMLSGHNHGGEITLFGLWAPALSKYWHVSDNGRVFRSGWAKPPYHGKVYVSNGVGDHSGFRMFARPQVIFMTLRSGTETIQ